MEATGATGREGPGHEGRPSPSPAEAEPGMCPQSWAQAGCRYGAVAGGGRTASPRHPRGGEWAGLPSLHCRLRGPDPPEEAGANQSQMWEQHKKC